MEHIVWRCITNASFLLLSLLVFCCFKIQFIQWLFHLKNEMQELFPEMQSGNFQKKY